MKTWQIFTLSVLTGFIATLAFAYASSPASPDGLKFCKIFKGYVDSVEGNITIKDAATGQIYYNGPLPADHKICIYTPHGTVVLIQWKDWRGQMSERHTILCEYVVAEDCDAYDELINCIPFPKSGEIGSG